MTVYSSNEPRNQCGEAWQADTVAILQGEASGQGQSGYAGTIDSTVQINIERENR